MSTFHSFKEKIEEQTKHAEDELVHNAKNSLESGTAFVKWILFAIIIGFVVGLFGILFSECLSWATAFRKENPVIIYGLPIAGIVIVWLYGIFHYVNDKGTNLVLSTIHAKSELPLRMAPLIFISTVLTHLFGGSAGREGAALQLGGSLANQIGRWLKLDEYDTRVMVMCGMSAAFSVLFGTPMAAAIFSLEVVSVGVMYYGALVPCVFSSLIASMFATTLEINTEHYSINGILPFHIPTVVMISILGILCAILSIVFIRLLHTTGDIYRKVLSNPFIRIIFSSVVIILLTQLLGTTIYSGSGTDLIEAAILGHVPSGAFLWKMIFTALTLEAGFKGGEIVPSFAVGAAFGCLFGSITGISPSLCAAVAMVSVFCGVTNCPITSMIIGFELFGVDALKYMLIGVSISYMLSGYYGLYSEQTIVYDKLATRFVNRKVKK